MVYEHVGHIVTAGRQGARRREVLRVGPVAGCTRWEGVGLSTRADAAKPLAAPRPASLLLVHGAGSGPWVFRGWARTFPGIVVAFADLQRGLDVTRASHEDYAENVVRAAAELPQPVSLCGWSMGGLVVLQANGRDRPHSAILLEASPPAEVQGFNPTVRVCDGSFDPEAIYGRFPPDMQPRLESSRARAERKRGISVPALPCPSLVVCGDEFREQRGRPIARLYGSQVLDFPGLGHWELVRAERVRTAISRWLGVIPPGE